MQLLRLVGATAVAIGLAGCASTGTSSAPPANQPSAVTSTPAASGSATGVPIPAPSDSEPITVSGPVTASVLSLTGPYQPAGPYLAASLNGLLAQMSEDLGGKAPACPAAGCWYGAKVPAGSVLLAVRPALTACTHVQHVQTDKLAAGSVRIDLQLTGSCRPGAGSAARMPAMLLALKSSTLSAIDSVDIDVRASDRPGDPMQELGKLAASLPLRR